VAKRDVRLMRLVQSANALQQEAVSTLGKLEVRRRDEKERLGIRGEPLAAAVTTLELAQQGIEPHQVSIRAAIVPDPQRQQGQHVHEVVIDEDREHRAIRRAIAPLLHYVIEHIDGDDVLIDVIGFAIPVVERVKSFLTRLAVEFPDVATEGDVSLSRVPRVGLHAFTKPQQRFPEVLRPREIRENLLASGSREGGLEEQASSNAEGIPAGC
jgi:hypothetical protein